LGKVDQIKIRYREIEEIHRAQILELIHKGIFSAYIGKEVKSQHINIKFKQKKVEKMQI
jgi:hypothetical protein